MKIATWNVNSLKVRLPHVLQWLTTNQPDILALQEIKMIDDCFPIEAFKQIGYHAVYAGQKTYNGVAILSRQSPIDTIKDIPDLNDPQRRILATTIDDIRILNLYVVNGYQVGTDKYAYKLHWLEKVTAYIKAQQQKYAKFIILGDFNIAPTDQDIHTPKNWREHILCSTAERQALQNILDLGFKDSFRLFQQPEKTWSWWDYRQGAFQKNKGLRIDLILSSQMLAEKCLTCYVDKTPRGWEKPSDHAPVVAEYLGDNHAI